MRTDGKAELQHYVPQILLRSHALSAGKAGRQVWCFDKQTDRVFPANIRSVLAGNRFYEVEVDGATFSLEEPLSGIEGQFAPIHAELLRQETLAKLTEKDRTTVAGFCAVQMVRTQAFRDQIRDITEGFAQALAARGLEPSVSHFSVPSEKEGKAFSMQMLADAVPTYAPHFLSKYWHLIASTPEDPFHIGDNPVTIDNNLQQGPGTLGLALPGVSIYLPLSPTLCLAMTDSVLIEALLEGGRRHREVYDAFKKHVRSRGSREEDVRHLKVMKDDLAQIVRGTAPMEHGTPSAHRPEVVTRINALQMLYAGRWIVSSRPDFSLPLQILADDPGLRNRRKFEVG